MTSSITFWIAVAYYKINNIDMLTSVIYRKVLNINNIGTRPSRPVKLLIVLTAIYKHASFNIIKLSSFLIILNA